MKEYSRQYPQYALCGLNCGLCPRYHTAGPSRCPGCGGPDFNLKHPACGVISCSLRHGQVEFCMECPEYPCARFAKVSEGDSFISYQHVLSDFAAAQSDGIETYIKQLDRKIEILNDLIDHWDDGRKKSFYCNAVNLLPLSDLENLMQEITKKCQGQQDVQGQHDGLGQRVDHGCLEDQKTMILFIVNSLKKIALARGVDLTLRK